MAVKTERGALRNLIHVHEYKNKNFSASISHIITVKNKYEFMPALKT